MKFEIHEKYRPLREELVDIISLFNTKGSDIQIGRNSIKSFELSSGLSINIKKFKTPHYINQCVYKYFRKSKAKRSFEYAQVLIHKKVGTPEPIAYLEKYTWWGLQESYYISVQQQYDYTFRHLVDDPPEQDWEECLRSFTRFCYDFHEKHIDFKDNSPGNTLILKKNNTYQFFLVDLNRMDFKLMKFEDRMQNLKKLTPRKDMVEIMSDEYAKCIGDSYQSVFQRLWELTSTFQRKIHRKDALKRKLGVKK